MDEHKKISFIKSAVRMLGCVFGFFAAVSPAVSFAFAVLFAAEIIGIVEEMAV